MPQATRLHLGCGKRNFGDTWIHVDGGDFPHVSHHDVTNLPFDDNSMDEIYASHVLEYFDWAEAQDVLKEWYRVLVPWGWVRIGVPDFAALARLYVQGLEYIGLSPVVVEFQGFNKSYKLRQKTTRLDVPLERIVGPLFGRMEMGGQLIYHKAPYDFLTLGVMLGTIGFINIDRFDISQTDHGHIDDHCHAKFPSPDPINQVQISLNMQAQKPIGKEI